MRYGEVNANPTVQPVAQHIDYANKIAYEITEKYTVFEQNEILSKLTIMVMEDRRMQIEETANKLARLEESYGNLSSFIKI